MTYSVIVERGTNDIAVKNHRDRPVGRYSRFIIGSLSPCKISNLVIGNYPASDDLDLADNGKMIQIPRTFLGSSYPITFTIESTKCNTIVIQAFKH